MTDEHDSAPISRLDGAQRRSVVQELWRKWRLEDQGAMLLFGVSGVGKSDGVVRPLRDWAGRHEIPTVWIDIPVDTMSFDSVLLDAVDDELDNGTHAGLTSDSTTLVAKLRAVLRAGGLVIFDEFQRALDPQGRPWPSMARILQQLSRRPADTGCLLLVSNRLVDWAWTESFHVAELAAPEDDADAVTIVLQQMRADSTTTRFPPGQRAEVVRRLGHNPRVLRLLGLLLNSHVLTDLLPPAHVDVTGPADPRLVEDIERLMVAKAAEGLPESARLFLRSMSVVRGWATWDLLQEIAGAGADLRSLIQGARDRYLLQARDSAAPEPAGRGGRYQLHPLLREVDRIHLRRDDTAWQTANRLVGGWYARKLLAAGRTAVKDSTLLAGLDGAWYHFQAAGADAEILSAVEPVQEYLNRNYGESAVRPSINGERDGRIALLEVYNAHWGVSGTLFHLAALLQDRGDPADLERAVEYARRSTFNQTHSIPWVLWIKLLRKVEGPEAAITAAREGLQKVSPDKGIMDVYQVLAS